MMAFLLDKVLVVSLNLSLRETVLTSPKIPAPRPMTIKIAMIITRTGDFFDGGVGGVEMVASGEVSIVGRSSK